MFKAFKSTLTQKRDRDTVKLAKYVWVLVDNLTTSLSLQTGLRGALSFARSRCLQTQRFFKQKTNTFYILGSGSPWICVHWHIKHLLCVSNKNSANNTPFSALNFLVKPFELLCMYTIAEIKQISNNISIKRQIFM